MKALAGVRVLDLTRLMPGAVATRFLTDFGADVLKVEQPGTGDYARHLFRTDGEDPAFRATNGGKRSIAIDLKHPRGREAFLALVARADVVFENFRPGVMERLGLDYETLRQHNPRIIYAALTGYGQFGPMSHLAGHDLNYLAVSGALSLIGNAGGPPVIPNLQAADIAGGSLQAVIGILLALIARERTGAGQFIDIAMTRGATEMLTVPLGFWRATGKETTRGEGLLSGEYACYNVYRTKDDRWLAVGVVEDKFWEALCTALGCADLIPMQYAPIAQQHVMRDRLAAIFAERTADEWLALLGPKDCCVTLVQTLKEAAESDWLGMDEAMPLLHGTPGERSETAPELGAHTRESLLDAGWSEAEIEEALRLGAIG